MSLNSTAQLLLARKATRTLERQLDLQLKEAGVDTTPRTRAEKRKAKLDRIGDRLLGS